MTHRRRLLLLSAPLLAVALAACSGGSGPTSAAATASPSAAPASAAPDPREARELDALLPDTIAGEQTRKLSMTGETLMASGSVDAASFGAFLERLGAQPSDVTFALATTPAADSQAFAYRVAGSDPAGLLREMQGSVAAGGGGGGVTWQAATVGGKQVQRGSSPATDNTIYLLPRGDTIFVIVTAKPATADEVIAGLP